uniref:Protein kinase domain-containing protein n=1 Tax=Globodera pallida TaxID=36090 RepID=A0A183CKT5_GLOPA
MLQCLNKIFTLDPTNESIKTLFGTYIEKYNVASGDRVPDRLDLEEAIRVAAQQSSGFYTVYEPKEVIGRGLASVVRRCVEKESKKQYAVKIVDLSTERQSEREAKRLGEETLSEVRLLKLLSGHPSIICLHEFFTTPTFLFAIFELARCELFEALNKSVTFSEKRTRLVMRQLFDGVRYLHSKKIIHRDLKLENILCIDDKRVVVSDFGFAKQLEPDQKLRDLFGTPGYLAPETLRCQMYEDAEGYGLEVDEWALGVIMYTLLAGYAPFYHRQQLRMMRLVQEGRYQFDKEQWESVSEEAKDLIRRLLMVNPAVRIPSRECLSHPWMTAGMGVPTSPARMVETPSLRRSLPQLRRLFRVVQHSICFMVRLRNFKQLKLKFDRGRDRTGAGKFDTRPKAHPSPFTDIGSTVAFITPGTCSLLINPVQNMSKVAGQTAVEATKMQG